ncbi:hypothetical protein [Shewanella halotolerans]|uniref:hypothetical protein n=1 Tax=Shewanella halotolerans TaxID=2864204 RepID=UPI001C65CB90|nr:hypothetical protein [Shewanella halotolerans]QYJ88396.1 hypothetical protein K0H81_11255 [Shewanella halotolerans]
MKNHLTLTLAAITLALLQAGCTQESSTARMKESSTASNKESSTVSKEESSTASKDEPSLGSEQVLGAEIDASLIVIPGQQFGVIQKGANLDEIRSKLGEANITATEIGMGEGETIAGFVAFKGEPEREFRFFFNQDGSMTAQISSPESRWRLLGEISIGTSLSQVEQVNQGPFSLYGFEWDYGGQVTNWQQGKLAQFEQSLTLTLTPLEFNEAAISLMGAREFASNDPKMIAADPRVSEIWVTL